MSGDDLNIGRLVAGRYRLDDLLGRGGFGSVYKGWDTQIERDVAVKLLDVANRSRSSKQTADLRERFRREAMAAGRITHRGIVTIFDFGIPDDGGEAYIIMEFLRGHDLAGELTGNGPMSPERVQRLFVPLLEGLGEGHDLGIVHKDIKPQNVFLSHPGTANESLTLVDFGVARVVHEDKLTMTGLIVGTPQYMAPEYITDTLVTPALDVYQMALILVEMITGMPAVPLGESFVKSCNRHFTGELAVPDELYDGEFGDLLKSALQPNPKHRLENGTLFSHRLAEIDPTTIVVEGGATMVFHRAPIVDTFEEPPMFPPMRPDQATAELEREEQERDSAVVAQPSDTLLEQSDVTPAELEPMAPRERVPVREAIVLPLVPIGQSSEASLASSDGETQPGPVVRPPGRSVSFVPIMAVTLVAVLLVGGAGIVLSGTQTQTPPQTPPKPVAEPVSSALINLEVKPLAAPEQVTIQTEPAGAMVKIGGVVLGETPYTTDVGPIARIEMVGFEPRDVALIAGLEPIRLAVAKPAAPAIESASETVKSPVRPKEEAGSKAYEFDPDKGESEPLEQNPVEQQDDSKAPGPAKFSPPGGGAKRDARQWDTPGIAP